MKTTLLASFISLVTLGGLAAPGARVVDSSFASGDWHSEWKHNDSNYYRPFGPAEQKDGVLTVGTNGRVECLLLQNESFDLKPEESVDITIESAGDKKAALLVGVTEYQDEAFVKSDIGVIWLDPAKPKATHHVVAKGNPKAPFNRARITFGPAKGHVVALKSISAVKQELDDAALAKSLPKKIALHFDASDATSLELDAQSRVKRWRDISGNSNDLVPVTKGLAPVVVKNGLNGRPVVRFDGTKKNELISGKALGTDGLTVFVVFKRDLAQGNGEDWQDVLSWGDGKNADNTGHTHLTLGANKGVEPPRIFTNGQSGKFPDPLRVGSNNGKRGFLSGDVCEILVYPGETMRGADVKAIRDYLQTKWNFSEADFVRFGPIPAPVKRISDTLPLSDQKNNGQWRLEKSMSDEFDGDSLDRTKWVDQVSYTLGRAPTRTLPDNAIIKDGLLQLLSEFDPKFTGGRLKERGPEYHSYKVGGIFSKFMIRYGYVEARAKIQPNAFSSTFWLVGGGIERATGNEGSPEIDIFELAGKSFAHTYSYNMALHYVQRKPAGAFPSAGKTWKSNFKFTEDFHVYGLEWTPKTISWYIDGHLIRRYQVERNMWDMGMNINISTEPQFGWFGIPEAKDLPSSTYFDYVRVWKNDETTMKDDWLKKYDNRHVMHDTGYAFDYYRQNGTKFVAPDFSDKVYEHVDLGTCENASAVKEWKGSAGGRAEWKNGLKVHFDAVLSRKDNGEVQYVNTNGRWPQIAMSASKLVKSDWSGYRFLAIDYENPGPDVQSVWFRAGPPSNPMAMNRNFLMKVGKGTVYLPDPPGGALGELAFYVRGGPEPNDFVITGLRVEK